MGNVYSKALNLIFFLSGIVSFINAQAPGPILFKDQILLPATAVKDQGESNTCWCFATVSLLESELLRKGKGETDLSEMFFVRKAYQNKATRFIRMHGKINFAGGGELNDVLDILSVHGTMPESAYQTTLNKKNYFSHSDLDKELKTYVDNLIKNETSLPPGWKQGVDAILDRHLGYMPDSFRCLDSYYNTRTYAAVLGLDKGDFVLLTSFNYHPWYSKFVLEIPDNWSWGEAWNIPLDELKQVFYYSLEHGYTFACAADDSEKGFRWKKGYAIVPDEDDPGIPGYNKETLGKMNTPDRDELIFQHGLQVNERTISDEMRQTAFDSYGTTDDHSMHVVGLARDQSQRPFFIVKNSWGQSSAYKGYLYASEPYLLYKTVAILVNRNGIPPGIAEKLGL
jgi:bleomycin hydrolase